MKSKRATIDEARKLQNSGRNLSNPNFGKEHHPDALLPTLFSADHIIHWRPDPSLPEENQYALVTSA